MTRAAGPNTTELHSPGSTCVTHYLARNATMRLPRRRSGFVVRVECGTALVTQQGDITDHVVEEGQQLVVTGQGLAIAWALSEATITVASLTHPRADDGGNLFATEPARF